MQNWELNLIYDIWCRWSALSRWVHCSKYEVSFNKQSPVFVYAPFYCHLSFLVSVKYFLLRKLSTAQEIQTIINFCLENHLKVIRLASYIDCETTEICSFFLLLYEWQGVTLSCWFMCIIVSITGLQLQKLRLQVFLSTKKKIPDPSHSSAKMLLCERPLGAACMACKSVDFALNKEFDTSKKFRVCLSYHSCQNNTYSVFELANDNDQVWNFWKHMPILHLWNVFSVGSKPYDGPSITTSCFIDLPGSLSCYQTISFMKLL